MPNLTTSSPEGEQEALMFARVMKKATDHYARCSTAVQREQSWNRQASRSITQAIRTETKNMETTTRSSLLPLYRETWEFPSITSSASFSHSFLHSRVNTTLPVVSVPHLFPLLHRHAHAFGPAILDLSSITYAARRRDIKRLLVAALKESSSMYKSLETARQVGENAIDLIHHTLLDEIKGRIHIPIRSFDPSHIAVAAKEARNLAWKAIKAADSKIGPVLQSCEMIMNPTITSTLASHASIGTIATKVLFPSPTEQERNDKERNEEIDSSQISKEKERKHAITDLIQKSTELLRGITTLLTRAAGLGVICLGPESGQPSCVFSLGSSLQDALPIFPARGTYVPPKKSFGWIIAATDSDLLAEDVISLPLSGSTSFGRQTENIVPQRFSEHGQPLIPFPGESITSFASRRRQWFLNEAQKLQTEKIEVGQDSNSTVIAPFSTRLPNAIDVYSNAANAAWDVHGIHGIDREELMEIHRKILEENSGAVESIDKASTSKKADSLIPFEEEDENIKKLEERPGIRPGTESLLGQEYFYQPGDVLDIATYFDAQEAGRQERERRKGLLTEYDSAEEEIYGEDEDDYFFQGLMEPEDKNEPSSANEDEDEDEDEDNEEEV